MGILKVKHHIPTLLFLSISFPLFLLTPTSSDNTNLIYKGCADQKLQAQYSQNLKPLLDSLVSASAQKGFAATTQNALTGAYQCRGDLSNSDCYNCVSKIPGMVKRLCGGDDSLYVLGQCEGSLGNEDCGGCIKSGAEQARDQCGDSISAQVYLQSCFLSYSFYPNGVPTASSSSSGGGGGHPHTERTVALAVGGVAALGFLIVCLLFLKSVLKRRGGKR
ncbi:Cysteine-rich repeat secretory protein 56 [Glycine soja]|nr:Cysteine-rich repeat secretory protein 56 [Glycine soja]